MVCFVQTAGAALLLRNHRNIVKYIRGVRQFVNAVKIREQKAAYYLNFLHSGESIFIES